MSMKDVGIQGGDIDGDKQDIGEKGGWEGTEEIFWLSFHVFTCACPNVISSIFGEFSLSFPLIWQQEIGTRVDEIKKNHIQKSKLRWFGQMIWMREERITTKCYTGKWRENDKEEDPKPDGKTKLEKM